MRGPRMFWTGKRAVLAAAILLLTSFARADQRAIERTVKVDGQWLRKDDLPQIGNYYALIIAISRYEPEEWRLKTPVNDGKVLAKLLKEDYGFKEVTELYDKDATLLGIRKAIFTLGRKAGPKDNVLIYYAGHGTLEGGTGFWIPFNATPGQNWSYLESVSLRDMVKTQRLKARHVLIVSDSCYSAALFRDMKLPTKGIVPEYIRQALRRPARQLLTSGGLKPVADGGGGEHSVFAKYFIKCLKNPPRDVFVPSDMMADLKFNVGNNAPKIEGERQVPLLGILEQSGAERGGEFVFVRRSKRAAAAAVVTPVAPAMPTAAATAFKRANELDEARLLKRKGYVDMWAAYVKQHQSSRYRIADAQARLTYWKKMVQADAPDWARVSEFQLDYAIKSKLPVAQELNIGKGGILRMVLIPPGEFVMGSPAGARDARDSETPAHKVHITMPFYLSIHEITQAQYEGVTGQNPSKFKDPKNPVERVKWNDMPPFCEALSKKTQRTITLPTEAQWEYACRAGTTTAYFFGDTVSLDQVNYGGRKGAQVKHVGSCPPNAWGLYDMHGNVRESCLDWYKEDYYRESPLRNPAGPETAVYRVARGGSWRDAPDRARSSARQYDHPTFGTETGGLRVVMSLSSKKQAAVSIDADAFVGEWVVIRGNWRDSAIVIQFDANRRFVSTRDDRELTRGTYEVKDGKLITKSELKVQRMSAVLDGPVLVLTEPEGSALLVSKRSLDRGIEHLTRGPQLGMWVYNYESGQTLVTFTRDGRVFKETPNVGSRKSDRRQSAEYFVSPDQDRMYMTGEDKVTIVTMMRKGDRLTLNYPDGKEEKLIVAKGG